MSDQARAWQTSSYPERMLELHPLKGDRKGRLFLVACCWARTALLPDGSRYAVSVAQRWVDGVAWLGEVERARAEADEASVTADGEHQLLADDLQAAEFIELPHRPGVDFEALLEEHERQRRVLQVAMVAHSTVFPSDHLRAEEFRRGVALLERDEAANLLRDIFGNPFRPVAYDAAWRTSTATALAAQMYESREFSAMPILADALQDAGCDCDDILNHCRDAHATHVRGCWVVDLVLGKS